MKQLIVGCMVWLWCPFLLAQNTTHDSIPATDTTLYRVAEIMPRFWGCEEIEGTDIEKKACADQALLKFLYTNLRYLQSAREQGVAGKVVVGFIIEKDGQMTNLRIIRDPGGGLGDEVLRVLRLMQADPRRWTPATQRGKPVRIEFMIPVQMKPSY